MGSVSNNRMIIDAGINNIVITVFDIKDKETPKKTYSRLIKSSENLKDVLNSKELNPLLKKSDVFVTGKLADVIKDIVPKAKKILSTASLWCFAKSKIDDDARTVAIVDLSASGYMIVGIDEKGEIHKDTLLVNPRCGAGSGINIDRILQKLNIARDEVDNILSGYLGENNKFKRQKINIRADRCGVFSSSATISDKNQGVPLDFALATTLKSEVAKTVSKLPEGFDKVFLTGRVFSWKFTRDCAKDILESKDVKDIQYDDSNDIMIDGTNYLIDEVGTSKFNEIDFDISKKEKLIEYPSFKSIKKELEKKDLYRRLDDDEETVSKVKDISSSDILIGLDVGSTMAKIVISDNKGDIILTKSYSNSGDTIETVRQIFLDLKGKKIVSLNILSIGITGSARYQVKQALINIYPKLKDRIIVIVENYAHARGSIDFAREHIKYLKKKNKEVNEDFCLLVDIGGEDTKISTIMLKEADLFDNAMNVKCSAGTGSLMDTLTSLFGIDSIGKACESAFNAKKSYAINATCAVFLMENARKLQAKGFDTDEILASANWAIVDNMSHSLWEQIEIPKNVVALLHGQTMLSEPLPVAVTSRLQDFVGSDIYSLVPPNPGHRACIGLIKSMISDGLKKAIKINIDEFIDKRFEKKIIVCYGSACGDKSARCNRTRLTASGCKGCDEDISFTLGGCTAVNELLGSILDKDSNADSLKDDSYKEIWNFIDSNNPKSGEDDRLVIPRSFAVSESAFFLANIFMELGIDVYVDNIKENDLMNGQRYFHIDTCAPHIGAVGQMIRLAKEPHGMILCPQIDFLSTDKKSMGRTCTINQGGIAVAKNLAETENPDANFCLFSINLKNDSPKEIAIDIFNELKPVFAYYDVDITLKRLTEAIRVAKEKNLALKDKVAEKASEIILDAIKNKRKVAIIAGREYILNPGIYDSHVGKLLKDKNIVALPSYIFDIDLNDSFSSIYWKNPHFLVSIIKSIMDKRFNKIIRNKLLKDAVKKLEEGEDLIPVVQISTFKCGPDSITNHLISEITKKYPFLLIQSDAIIKELAHLENRVNTYSKQLENKLHEKILNTDDKEFKVEILEDFVNHEKLNRKKDVIYFPTLADNRVLTSVFRSAGFVCIDNYDDETYDLQSKIKKGRAVAGDSVCAPLAAVYADVLEAVDDFKRRRDKDDPLVKGKNRILVFNNQGTGPCRQGQYADVHKLFSYRKGLHTIGGKDNNMLFKFLIGTEKEGYNFGVDDWVFLKAIQGAVLQAVLHQMLFTYASNASSIEEYNEFMKDYISMKKDIYKIQENFKISKRVDSLSKRYDQHSIIGILVRFFGYDISSKEISARLKKFSYKWKHMKKNDGRTIKIYIEGEAYMRVAQAEDIFRVLLNNLGFKKFTLEYSPIWSYFEYLMCIGDIFLKERCEKIKEELKLGDILATKKEELQKEMKALKKKIRMIKILYFSLRNIIAKPMYKAADVVMPDKMDHVLNEARKVLSTLKPSGELAPYVGEAISKIDKGYDLFLNVAPEGCMVSSMGEILTPAINDKTKGRGLIQNLFSQDGEVDEELINISLLKVMGPVAYYKRN